MSSLPHPAPLCWQRHVFAIKAEQLFLPPSCCRPQKLPPRIINGDDAPLGRYPYAVALFWERPGPGWGSWENYVMCGGALIAKNVVLSAGKPCGGG